LRDFQRDAGLEPTGELDDATIAALEKEHRS
ncbi:MAG: peptidoglycan-binding protein, partial [Myxococcales bacterium]|nr:peptidoglycan-binding protein [Myxococcales bacterium]